MLLFQSRPGNRVTFHSELTIEDHPLVGANADSQLTVSGVPLLPGLSLKQVNLAAFALSGLSYQSSVLGLVSP